MNEQFGFKTKSSTAKATFNLINEMLEALNSKKVVGGIFCNLVKTLLWYDIYIYHIYDILCKLNFYGIRGPFLNKILSYK